MPYPLLRVTCSSLRFKFDKNRSNGSKVIAEILRNSRWRRWSPSWIAILDLVRCHIGYYGLLAAASVLSLIKIGPVVQKLQQNIDIQDGGRRHLDFRKMTKWPISTSWNLHLNFFLFKSLQNFKSYCEIKKCILWL